MPMETLNQLTNRLKEFRDERDWGKFHNPKDLALAINIETSELLELFLWKNFNEVEKEKIELEVADIFAYLLLFVDKYKIDLSQILLKKIELNKIKYPVDKFKGISTKYDEL
jgi:NTP pyrophosphatase (non-canonical NTP hydrolase)